jgi:hypothetical protein
MLSKKKVCAVRNTALGTPNPGKVEAAFYGPIVTRGRKIDQGMDHWQEPGNVREFGTRTFNVKNGLRTSELPCSKPVRTTKLEKHGHVRLVSRQTNPSLRSQSHNIMMAFSKTAMQVTR